MGIFHGLLPKSFILLGLPCVCYLPHLCFLGLPGFLLFCLPFLLDAFAGCSQLRLCCLLDPHLLSCGLALDLFEILFWIQIHQNRFWVYDGGDSSGIDVLGGHGNIIGKCNLGKKKILTLPTITIRLLSPGTSFCLYFKLHPNFTWNLIGSYVFIRISG